MKLWAFLLIGLAIAGAGVAFLFVSTKGAHLDLKGEILKVRVLQLNPMASIVVLDFRVSNPSDVRFVVRTVAMTLDPASGEPVEGSAISKPDVESVFQTQKLLGPKYNDVLSIRDQVPPRQTIDRMTGARFELAESAINARKRIRLRIEDVDGTVVELTENGK
jgi:hypothetical protein